MSNVRDLIQATNQQWTNMIGRSVIAPIYPESYHVRPQVNIKVNGLVVTLNIVNTVLKPGIAFVQVVNRETAQFVRFADMRERYEYVNLFHRIQLVLVEQIDDFSWLGIQAQKSQRINIDGLCPIYFVNESLSRFETVACAFDGANLIYSNRMYSENPTIPEVLSNNLDKLIKTNHVSKMTTQEKLAYTIALQRKLYTDKVYLEEQEKKSILNERDRLAHALGYQGASLMDYYSDDDKYIVTYTVDGERFRSVIDKSNLQVQSAGVCLNYTDSKYDLTTVVAILRSGINKGRIYRTSGTGDDDDDDDD